MKEKLTFLRVFWGTLTLFKGTEKAHLFLPFSASAVKRQARGFENL